jgi:predicted RNA-binding protein with PUA-like domain
MALWLCKVEPDCYSYDDLARDGSTAWDGVANPVARKNLRAMKPGDRVFFYHTGKEKAVVGEMVVAADPVDNPDGSDEKAVAVEMKPVRKFDTAVTLAQIKAEDSLATWDLVRLPRLSVLSVTPAQWKRVEDLASGKGRTGKK